MINLIILSISIYIRSGTKNCSGEGCLGLVIFSFPLLIALIYVIIFLINRISMSFDKHIKQEDSLWQQLLFGFIFLMGYLILLMKYKY